MKTLNEKKAELISRLSGLDSLLVAFSGGVDSTFLLAVAHKILGSRLIAVTAYSPVHPVREQNAACQLAQRMGVNHTLIRSEEMADPGFVSNLPDRCYRCKIQLFGHLLKMAADNGIRHVAHGVNLDDLKDYRPGLKAAEELQIKAPLVDAGLSKADIRELSREMGLTTWDKPAMACLASRIPYGTPLTVENLGMVEQAEQVLHDLGFRSCRVRHHGSLARLEVPPADFSEIVRRDVAVEIVSRLQGIGFIRIALDLEGYIQGSMNRGIST